MLRTPIALMTYNRPTHADRALKALARCTGLDCCALTIYCDAPRSSAHQDAVAANRAVVRRWADQLGATLVERTENLGLARSIAGAVSQHVMEAGQVIVLEDDLVTTPDFLNFMLAGLKRYADARDVAQISGCLLTGRMPAARDAFFLPLTTTWGWATWARAWSDFRWDVDAGELDRDPDFRARFTLGGMVDYEGMLRARLGGANDSWGILWWFAVARSAKLVLYPRESLVWNGGFDNSGVHCGGTEIFQPEPPAAFQQARLPSVLRLPDRIEADEAAMATVRGFLGGPAAAIAPTLAAPAPPNWFDRLSAAARRLTRGIM